MTLQCELQLDAFRRVSPIDRFLQVDGSGGIVKITKHMNRHYGPVRTVVLFKNLFIIFCVFTDHELRMLIENI